MKAIIQMRSKNDNQMQIAHKNKFECEFVENKCVESHKIKS